MTNKDLILGGVYKLNWELIEEEDYHCDYGGTFMGLMGLAPKDKLFGRVVSISEEDLKKVEIRLFTKNRKFHNWFLVCDKLIPVENSIKKVE
ncbi:MAG: hypothetical protein ACOC1O_01905 [bacterium]